MLLQLSQVFPFAPSTWNLHSLQQSPPTKFMFMGHAYNFFGYSISYTVLMMPLSILYLKICAS